MGVVGVVSKTCKTQLYRSIRQEIETNWPVAEYGNRSRGLNNLSFPKFDEYDTKQLMDANLPVQYPFRKLFPSACLSVQSEDQERLGLKETDI